MFALIARQCAINRCSAPSSRRRRRSSAPHLIFQIRPALFLQKRKAHHLVCFSFWRYRPDLNWRITVLQTGALPLGYGTKKYGAGDEARTRYLHLGKVALYRMSYTRIYDPIMGSWCLRSESNQRHADFQSAALPTELQRHIVESSRSPRCVMATPNGLEPSTSSVTGWRANRLHHRAMKDGGNNRARTCDLLLVRQMLSQLSYAPVS